jgi:hypothetical protein
MFAPPQLPGIETGFLNVIFMYILFVKKQELLTESKYRWDEDCFTP